MDQKALRRQFDALDSSGDGSLDAKEVKRFLVENGLNAEDRLVRQFISVADTDNSGTIEWAEFKVMFELSLRWHEFVFKLGQNITCNGVLSDYALRRQFIGMDRDGNGSVDTAELAEVFRNLGIEVSADLVEKLLLIADADGSGSIEWPEFKRMFDVIRDISQQEPRTPDSE